jgi:hypothetical protein
VKFKQYLSLISDPTGFIPTPRFQWVIRKNDRSTSREEAIAAEVIRQANPRENITGHYPWGPEEQFVLQQLWIQPDTESIEWRDVPTAGVNDLYSNVNTEFGELPVPNAVKEPGVVQADFGQRLREILGGD